MARKWRQIDKFLELVDDVLDALPERLPGSDGTRAPIRVVDFGCGKGYLTFAVHAHLRRRFGVAPEVVGVELRPELVDFCNAVAQRTRRRRPALRRGRPAQFHPARRSTS